MIPESGQQTSPGARPAPGPATTGDQPAALLRVALPVPLRRLFDYLPIPDQPLPATGSRVVVPFGKRRLMGILIEHGTHSEIAQNRLRQAIDYPDPAIRLDEQTMALLRWTADYYHHPLGETLHTALPPRLRKVDSRPRTESHWRAMTRPPMPADEALAKAPRQREALQRIRDADGMSHRELLAQGFSAAQLRSLEARGYIGRAELPEQAYTHPEPADPVADDSPQLNADQAAACDQLQDAGSGFCCWLLEGVTGSGKTEIYLRQISAALQRGRQALLLVPEISLTPQTLERLARRIGGRNVLSLHSGMSERERSAVWERMASGATGVLIGTRSAVFTPLPRLDLIVVDEEHDPSFKQQDGLRYSARDLAVWRGHQAGIHVILGSATPSLETLQNAENGRYRHLQLPRRAGQAAPPRLQIEDIHGQQLVAGMGHSLRSRVREALTRGSQVLLFLNRRGFAPVCYCSDCSGAVGCPDCDVHMTVHLAARQLRCHHCGMSRPLPRRCPHCGSDQLLPLGAGTQRIEQELAALYPGTPILRVDRDSMQSEQDHRALQARMRQAGPAILVGTQLLAKGHDFPRITLVGVLDIDAGLLSADFRAAERTGQLLSQVAGRAGRGRDPGMVIIQTRNPAATLLQQVTSEGYGAFARQLLLERRAAGLPPFTHLAKLNSEAAEPEQALALLQAVADELGPATERSGSELWGPVLSPMQRRGGRYRAQLVVCNPSRTALHALLGALMPMLEARRMPPAARWSLDVDPIDLY